MHFKLPKEINPPPAPAAMYKATVNSSDWVLGKTKDNTKDMITLKVTLLSQGPTEVVTVGKGIKDYLTITEDSIWKLDTLLFAASGSHLSGGQEFESIEQFAQTLMAQVVGKEFLVLTKVDSGSGRERAIVEEYRPIAA